jgi:hypothetical protein
MASGFSVYLENLIQVAKYMDEAADAFDEVKKTANGPGRIAENALGFFGGASNFPVKYQSMCQNVANGADQARGAFLKAANEFIALEKRYAKRDDYWAKEFGVKADHIKPKIPDFDNEKPPPGGGGQQQPAPPRVVPLPPAKVMPPKQPTQTI